MEERKFSEQELVRREKMQELIDKGIDPFGQRFDVTAYSKGIKEQYGEKTHEELEEMAVEVSVAGRIMTKRRKGKVCFMHIQDRDGQIQLYVRKDTIGEDAYEIVKKGDIGDIIGVKGTVFMTNTGECSIKVSEYTHLTKALRPLPEKFHGLSDIEERYRRRYVDLIMNEDAKKIAFTRPRIIRSIQHYLDSKNYVEVETPVLNPILGGAAARPFVTHHNTLDTDFYLRIATELSLKRLIVGGMDAVYEIGRLFRNEGMDRTHNPEFTTIEVYKAFSDLEGMMDLTEGIISNAAMEVNGTYELDYKGHHISLAPGFKRVSMTEAIKEKTGIDFNEHMSFEDAKKLAEEHGIEVEAHFGYGHIINEFFEKYVEETLPAIDFIKRLIRHIPEKHFKMIRYGGIYARHREIDKHLHRAVAKEKHHVFRCFNQWRTAILSSFGYDPLQCPDCRHEMEFLELYYNHQRVSLEELYEKAMSKSRGKRSSA